MIHELTIALGIVMVGYVYKSYSNFHKIKFLSSSNYVILYESILAGFLMHVWSWATLALAKLVLTKCSFDDVLQFRTCSWESNFPFFFADVLAGAAILATSRVKVENRLRTDDEAKEDAVRKSGTIPSLILDMIRSKELVEIVTFRRKVYIGWIERVPGISTKNEVVDLTILPLFSGYRDEATLELVLRTYYGNVLRQLEH